MIPTNYKCENCGTIFEFFKINVVDDFPKNVPCTNCNSPNTWRMWGIGAVSFAQGNFGNSANSYENSFTYHPSEMGRYKGKKIKTIKG
jgi:DNA-directed RNA polymerase subunit RPC12/RpoP